MYQEDHGIIHNKFYDTKLQKEITFGRLEKFSSKTNRIVEIGTGDDGQWADPKIEPIWITATKQVRNYGIVGNGILAMEFRIPTLVLYTGQQLIMNFTVFGHFSILKNMRI